jgi:hypothetical protein
MLEAIFSVIGRVLTWTFVIGMAGCILVIPIVAYKLFSVLFEEDQPDEN